MADKKNGSISGTNMPVRQPFESRQAYEQRAV